MADETVVQVAEVKQETVAEKPETVEAKPVEARPQPQVVWPAVQVKPKKKRAKRKGILVKAKKKEAVARATIRKGSGVIRINKRNAELIEPLLVKRLVKEPVVLAGPMAAEVDIEVNVHGGGFMSQAVSARAAIAKALVEYTQNDKLKNAFLKYDRMLLVDDTRRVEPKKPLGPKARRKKQKSKR